MTFRKKPGRWLLITASILTSVMGGAAYYLTTGANPLHVLSNATVTQGNDDDTPGRPGAATSGRELKAAREAERLHQLNQFKQTVQTMKARREAGRGAGSSRGGRGVFSMSEADDLESTLSEETKEPGKRKKLMNVLKQFTRVKDTAQE